MDLIVSFYCIFNEDIMPHNIIDNVISQSQIARTMESESSVEALMDGVSFYVGVMHVTNHMEMDSISAKLECLTHVRELTESKSSCQRVISHRVKEHCCSILLSR